MATVESSTTSPNYFVLTDSHVEAVSGLKWVDNYNPGLSALALLSTPIIEKYLYSTKALMFLVGTNSVRCTPASTIHIQIKALINSLRSRYANLLDKHCINIIPCFPCFKPFYPLNTYYSLLNNIAQYNAGLVPLAINLNFTIVDFHVMDHHIGGDRMHLHFKYNTLVKNSIINYFEYLSSSLTAIPVKAIGRSREAKARHNKRQQIKLSLKQQQFYLSRPIVCQWSLKSIKNYLHQQQIKFAKIPPIYRNTVRIQFNNSVDLQIAEATLRQDAFSQ